MARRFGHINVIACCAVVALATAITGCGSGYTEAQAQASRETGNAIAAVLDDYLRDKGRYPTNLEELVPEYIDKIEPPQIGTWKYEMLDDGRTYSLLFRARGEYPVWIHTSDSRECSWFCDTG